jgi:hypothetical protein
VTHRQLHHARGHDPLWRRLSSSILRRFQRCHPFAHVLDGAIERRSDIRDRGSHRQPGIEDEDVSLRPGLTITAASHKNSAITTVETTLVICNADRVTGSFSKGFDIIASERLRSRRSIAPRKRTSGWLGRSAPARANGCCEPCSGLQYREAFPCPSMPPVSGTRDQSCRRRNRGLAGGPKMITLLPHARPKPRGCGFALWRPAHASRSRNSNP